MSAKIIITLLAIAPFAAACGHELVKPPVAAMQTNAPAVVEKTAPMDDSERTAQAVTKLIGLDAEILRVCNLHFGAAQPQADLEEGAPRFDYDESGLSTQDTTILSQVARCLTNGPLAGRKVRLVGRADSRGSLEYNFLLGAHRASTVSQYLEQQGVAQPRINETSRGELDATGTSESSMRDDRRVDILLGS